MFKGLGAMSPFTLTFSNGVVSGPSFSFDLKGIIGGLNEAQKAFYRSNPAMLIDYAREAWNKQFTPQCIVADGDKLLGVQWDTGCLIASGTSNLFSNAAAGILSAVAAWGTAVLGTATTPPPSGGGTQPPTTTTQCATVGKSPIAGQVCCTGLVKDPFNVCNVAGNIPGGNNEVCQGTFICSIPDWWLYAGIAALLLLRR